MWCAGPSWWIRQALRNSPAPARAACNRRMRAAEGSALYNASKAICPRCCGASVGYPARNHRDHSVQDSRANCGDTHLILLANWVFSVSDVFSATRQPSLGRESVYVRRLAGVGMNSLSLRWRTYRTLPAGTESQKNISKGSTRPALAPLLGVSDSGTTSLACGEWWLLPSPTRTTNKLHHVTCDIALPGEFCRPARGLCPLHGPLCRASCSGLCGIYRGRHGR